MLTVATLLWDPNPSSLPFSRCYDESWVEKLYLGVSRHLTLPFQFVLFTDRHRPLGPWCQQWFLSNPHPRYLDCLEPYRLGDPMILMGLDTVIVGPIDHLAMFALASPGVLALPRDPYYPHQACNGVALAPADMEDVWFAREGSPNDMDAVRRYPHEFLDDIFPGHVISYKVHMRDKGLTEPPPDTRIVYFHGDPKMHQVDEPWIRQNWR